MNLKAFLPLAAAAIALSAPAGAVVITADPAANLADFSYNVNVATRTINIFETFGPDTAASVILKFEGWSFGSASWVINKYVTNETGADFGSFSHELLQSDLGGSPDDDGLSFAQFGSPFRTRASDSFGTVSADELADRDYLLFDEGSILDGATGWFTFGITARRATEDTRTFYLRQSEFLDAVPEPATWAMLITGFGMVGFSMRRRRMGMTSVNA